MSDANAPVLHTLVPWGDATVVVFLNRQGRLATLMQPVVARLGLPWKSQRDRLNRNPHLGAWLGLELDRDIPPAIIDIGRPLRRGPPLPMWSMRLDRVGAFIATMQAEWMRRAGVQWPRMHIEGLLTEWMAVERRFLVKAEQRAQLIAPDAELTL